MLAGTAAEAKQIATLVRKNETFIRATSPHRMRPAMRLM